MITEAHTFTRHATVVVAGIPSDALFNLSPPPHLLYTLAGLMVPASIESRAHKVKITFNCSRCPMTFL